MRKALKQPYKQFFGTLANQTRLDIINALRTESMNVTAISEATGFEQSMISHNLKRLVECGFVTVVQEGREKTCTLNDESIKPLLELMEAHMHSYCCHVVADKVKKGKEEKLCH